MRKGQEGSKKEGEKKERKMKIKIKIKRGNDRVCDIKSNND